MEYNMRHPVRVAIVGAGHVGATYYAIATGLVRIIEAIVRNENSVLTVSSLVNNIYGLKGVSMSLPSIVNRQGAVQVLELPQAEEEYGALNRSAQIIGEAIGSVGS